MVFYWLRDERSGKRFSHTRARLWVRVCRGGGLQVTWRFRVQLFLFPSTIAWPSIRGAFFTIPLFCFFFVFCNTFWWRRRARARDLVLWKDCSRTTVVWGVVRGMLERNAVNLPVLRHTTILVRDRLRARRPILQTGPKSCWSKKNRRQPSLNGFRES